MRIFYNLSAQCVVDQSNCRLNTKPVLFLGTTPTWELFFYDGEPGSDPVPADVSSITAWRAAVDSDWDHSSPPMVRTSDGIDKSGAAQGIIRIPLDANTEPFAEKIRNNQSIAAFFEIRGFSAEGAAELIVVFNITCHNAIDPLGGEILPPADDVASKTWVREQLAGSGGGITEEEKAALKEEVTAAVTEEVTASVRDDLKTYVDEKFLEGKW